jgi:hypothetical protein
MFGGDAGGIMAEIGRDSVVLLRQRRIRLARQRRLRMQRVRAHERQKASRREELQEKEPT